MCLEASERLTRAGRQSFQLSAESLSCWAMEQKRSFLCAAAWVSKSFELRNCDVGDVSFQPPSGLAAKLKSIDLDSPYLNSRDILAGGASNMARTFLSELRQIFEGSLPGVDAGAMLNVLLPELMPIMDPSLREKFAEAEADAEADVRLVGEGPTQASDTPGKFSGCGDSACVAIEKKMGLPGLFYYTSAPLPPSASVDSAGMSYTFENWDDVPVAVERLSEELDVALTRAERRKVATDGINLLKGVEQLILLQVGGAEGVAAIEDAYTALGTATPRKEGATAGSVEDAVFKLRKTVIGKVASGVLCSLCALASQHIAVAPTPAKTAREGASSLIAITPGFQTPLVPSAHFRKADGQPAGCVTSSAGPLKKRPKLNPDENTEPLL